MSEDDIRGVSIWKIMREVNTPGEKRGLDIVEAGKKRLTDHNAGECKSTKPYIPLQLPAYVGVRSEN